MKPVRADSLRAACVLLLFGYCWFAGRAGAQEPVRQTKSPAKGSSFVFREVSDETGLAQHLMGIRGHGAGWGDVDGDGWFDLYVATFHSGDSQPNLLLRNEDGEFQLDQQPSLQLSMRGTGVVFADLDNDGDTDLYLGSMPSSEDSRLTARSGHQLVGCSLFENEGQGRFSNVSRGNGACPVAFGGRSATVLDFDGDGLLDILVGEDPLLGYNGSPTASSRLFRNLGDLQFEDVTRAAGLPADIPGLGVAAGDVNNDTWPDIFIAAADSNRLFLNDGRGRFYEPSGARAVFAWTPDRGDDMVCGVALGDVNRDGLLDIVIGQHYERPWQTPVANRLYLNRGIADGVPAYQDVTEDAGLLPLPMKAPHVEIQDFDNDGWPDISASVVKFAGGQPYPIIFHHGGVAEGVPQFGADALQVNDFPTEADKSIRRSGQLFDKVLREKKIFYAAPGPSADFDNDGRLDMFLPSWWSEASSLLLRNETPGGHWLQVQLEVGEGTNRMGIGSRVYVYRTGELGEAGALLACQEVATGYGYASGQPTIAHFGLGAEEVVDLKVVLPHGRGHWDRQSVRADQKVLLKVDDP